jgi:hypothetical protein
MLFVRVCCEYDETTNINQHAVGSAFSFFSISVKPMSQKTCHRFDLKHMGVSLLHSFDCMTQIHAIYNAQQHNHSSFSTFWRLICTKSWFGGLFFFVSCHLCLPNTCLMSIVSIGSFGILIIHSRYLGTTVHTMRVCMNFIYHSISIYMFETNTPSVCEIN